MRRQQRSTNKRRKTKTPSSSSNLSAIYNCNQLTTTTITNHPYRTSTNLMSSSSSIWCLAFIYFLAQILANSSQNCNAQKAITLNQHHHQNYNQLHHYDHNHNQNQQQRQQQHNGTTAPTLQLSQQQAKQSTTNQMFYQNYSLAMSQRPLERPSLTLVNNNNDNKQSASIISAKEPAKEHPLEGAADWFMLGGVADTNGDLQTDEARPSSSVYSDRSGQTAASSRRRKSNGKHQASNKTSASTATTSTTSQMEAGDEQADSSDSNEIYDDVEESGGAGGSLAGLQKEPECASNGRYYCTYKEDYPLKLVTEVTKYYKWPLEKLFRDLHAQIMPKLAQDSTGNLVCDSITRVVRPGWARNTNDRWLVVINTDNYHQYVTEVVCQYGTNSRCNFIPPCYYSSCQQRYNTQKLLVIDPNNPYRGPFLSEFLFPSCCVCYVPSASESFQDKYKPSPATIYQRTMQQESAANLNPPQFRPPGIMDDVAVQLADQSAISSRTIPSVGAGGISSAGSAGQLAPISTTSGSTGGASGGGGSGSGSGNTNSNKQNQTPGVGEIRRGGDQYRARQMDNGNNNNNAAEFGDFPRLGLADSLVSPKSGQESLSDVRQ